MAWRCSRGRLTCLPAPEVRPPAARTTSAPVSCRFDQLTGWALFAAREFKGVLQDMDEEVGDLASGWGGAAMGDASAAHMLQHAA